MQLTPPFDNEPRRFPLSVARELLLRRIHRLSHGGRDVARRLVGVELPPRRRIVVAALPLRVVLALVITQAAVPVDFPADVGHQYVTIKSSIRCQKKSRRARAPRRRGAVS